ncbi:biphenyl-2,3-diol 1,2-dioxygenase [Acinetobacter sp. ANC 4635]|uniref:biphenyl-2,3-diol 1,2-dioxygenase n=1 Tax=Acinetobacter sp. ANC 4635 TaxID=2529846 RepID=UPI0010394956|nr:biphenyl-2,3-diol 1,2-dioxygenase [Acinetobacter sp. ANC 4635]TCB28493.1 biphenyl-2,3-diol 1,2-dioxygenase [Acinetobacter sp. ANC 4635]
MSIKKLGYLGFEVADVPKWSTFATTKLGMMEASASETEATFRVDSRAWRLSVSKGPADDYLFAGYEVDNEQELQELKQNLEAHGVSVKVEGQELTAKRGVLGLISFSDPFGNRIEVYYGGTELFERPFVSPTGVSGFQTGDQGLGHYVLNVEDVDAALAFYTKALGFQLADIINWTIGDGLSTTLYFFYCNGRHHSFAFAKLPGSKRLHHFMLQVNGMDDVGLANDKFDADRTVVMTLGRHTNDHMISFYGATPSGFAVEYGWGAREVTHHWSVVRYDSISIWGHKFQAPA